MVNTLTWCYLYMSVSVVSLPTSVPCFVLCVIVKIISMTSVCILLLAKHVSTLYLGQGLFSSDTY